MKKKYYILIGLITCMFMFLPVSDVRAEDTMLCEYKGYYDTGYGVGEERVLLPRTVTIKYDYKNDKFYVTYIHEKMSDGVLKGEKSITSGDVYLSPSASSTLNNNGQCPKRAFLDVDNTLNICFDDSSYNKDGGHCPKKSTSREWTGAASFSFSERLELKNNGIDIAYGVLLNDFNASLDSEISTFYNQKSTYYETKGELNKSGRGVCNSLISKLEGQREVAFINDTIYPIIEGTFDRNIGNKFPNTISEKYKEEKKDELIKKAKENQSVKNLLNDCYKMIDAKVENNEMTQQEGEQLKESLTTEKLYDSEHFDKLLDDLFPDVYIEKDDIYKGKYYCGIFGEGSFEIVKDLFGIVKMLIPAIIILLGMADFLKVVFSGEEKDMKSAGMRLVKRLIIGIIFILLPVLLGFIFDIVGFSETCLGQLV